MSYTNMKSLRLNNGNIRQKPCTRLSIRREPLSNIRDLDLCDSDIDDDTLEVLIASLADNDVLQRLKLRRNSSVTPSGWATMMPFLQSCKLTSLDLAHNLIDDAIAIRLAHSLVNNDTLKKLDLSHNELITSTGFTAFAPVFQSPVTRLESFHLVGNVIDDVSCIALANSLSNNSTLRKLWLGRSNLVTSRGLIAFATLLQNTSCQINVLNFSRCHVKDDAAVALATSLVNNTKLKYLNLGDVNSVTATGWRTFSHLLCDTSSFDTIYDSNHTLGLLGFGLSQLPPEVSSSVATVEKYLEYNRMGEQRSRQLKILDHYFSSDFGMAPFVDMEVQILAHILAWISKIRCSNNRQGPFALEQEKKSQSAMFHLLRSEPSLFGGLIKVEEKKRPWANLLLGQQKTDRAQRTFSWSSFWKPFVSQHISEKTKQATAPAVAKKKRAKKESVGYMLYGDSMNDQVDQQIEFLLGLPDSDRNVNLEDDLHRIISIDGHKGMHGHIGHTKLNEVADSLGFLVHAFQKCL